MPQQKHPIKLQVAQGSLLYGLSIIQQARSGGNLLLPCRLLPRHGGHLQDGKRGECKSFSFFSQDIDFWQEQFPCKRRRGVKRTPHRSHFAHAIFSRVWPKIESQTQCEANRVPLIFLFVILAHHVSSALVMV